MPIQLAFDGTVKLIKPFLVRDLHVVIDCNAGHCAEEAAKLAEPADAHALWLRLAFAVTSVNSPFDATCKAWLAMQDTDPADWPAIRDALRVRGSDGVVSYQPTKTRWLTNIWYDMTRNGVSYWPDLPDLQYRDYLRSSVTGLAWAKSSFAVMLVKGSADVACIDTHMHRILTGRIPGKQIRKELYVKLEQSVRRLAKRHGIPCSVAQHAIWDAARGVRSPLLPERNAA